MAKRTIQECDLSKEEFDPDEVWKITIKKPGQSRGRSYELSPASAAKLEQQLVSRNKLDPNWGFSVYNDSTPQATNEPPMEIPQQEADPSDEELIREKLEQRKQHYGNDDPGPVELKAVSNDCRHLNKSAPRLKTVTNQLGGQEKAFVQECKNCGKEIKVKKERKVR